MSRNRTACAEFLQALAPNPRTYRQSLSVPEPSRYRGSTVTGLLDLALRSALAPGVIASRWLAPPGRPFDREAPRPAPSLGVLAKMLLDEAFFLSELLSLRLSFLRDFDRLMREVRDAVAFLAERGWLTDPRSYHGDPPPLEPLDMRRARSRGIAYQHLRFASEYAPAEGEPGRERWLGYLANRTAHAWVLEHPGPPRPWLVCIHGYRMGFPLADFTGFPVHWLHHRLGLNLVFPVLPLHGPRRRGRRTGDGFLTGDYLDTVHLQAQATWDIRRVLAWLREERDAPAVGAYGLSLGGYTAALLAGLSADLDVVICGVPATSHTAIARRNLPTFLVRSSEWLGFSWEHIEALLRVVSPLSLPPLIPWERRFLYAGTADRLVPADGVCALWRHWDRPRLEWYHGSHVSFRWERPVRRLLREALGTLVR